MEFRKILFLALIFLGGAYSSFSCNSAGSEKKGIEPISETTNLYSAVALETAKIAKKENSGIGKLFSWVKKKTIKLVKKIADIGGIDDPVDKWFWYWIIGWGAAIVLSALHSGWIFGVLSGLAVTFGTVALVIWLIKRYE
jgi:hypothetical protein